MTTPSQRAIRWDHPVESNPLYPPSANNWGFAAWLATKEPQLLSEEHRIDYLSEFVDHVITVYKPNWPPKKHRSTKIPAVAQDPKIQEEFTRWARSLDFTQSPHFYTKHFEVFTYPVSWPWFAEAAKTVPALVFGFQLAIAMRMEQTQFLLLGASNALATEELNEKITALSKCLTLLGLQHSMARGMGAVQQLLQFHDECNPGDSLVAKVEMLKTLFANVTSSEHPSGTLRAKTELDDLLFAHLLKDHNPKKTPELALDLPAEFDGFCV